MCIRVTFSARVRDSVFPKNIQFWVPDSPLSIGTGAGGGGSAGTVLKLSFLSFFLLLHFNFRLLLPEGRAGEDCEPSNKVTLCLPIPLARV
jgi:hypothetical protein